MSQENQPKSQPSKPRKPMSEQTREEFRQRMALARAKRGTLDVKPKAEKSDAPDSPILFSIKLTPRTMGRLQCLLDAKDFTFANHDDLIAWLIRQAAQANRTVAFHLNMRYQVEREQIPKIL